MSRVRNMPNHPNNIGNDIEGNEPGDSIRKTVLVSRFRPGGYVSEFQADTSMPDHAEASTKVDHRASRGAEKVEHALAHRLKAGGSILALVVDDECIYAGLQGGDIAAWKIETYECVLRIHAHQETVLGLFMSDDHSLLFSCGGDAIVNIWSTRTFERLYSIYSHHDIGDLLSVIYSSDHKTVYCGAQNTSIQWFDLKQNDNKPLPDTMSHPSNRTHLFFDSKGPGGVSTPRPDSDEVADGHGGQLLAFPKEQYKMHAHNGYINCMLLARGLVQTGPEEEILISGAGDGTIKLWSIDVSKEYALLELAKLEDGDDGVLSLAIEGTFLYCGLIGGKISIWNLESRRLVHKIAMNGGDVWAIDNIGGVLYAGDTMGKVEKFNTHFEPIDSWAAHDGKILASAVAKFQGRRIYVTGANDRSVAIWDVSRSSRRPSELLPVSNDEMINTLGRFVSFQTVSSNPKYVGECNQGANFLRRLFSTYGANSSLLSTGKGTNPVVYARFKGNPKLSVRHRTILFYGHYDVVDVDTDTDGGWDLSEFGLPKVEDNKQEQWQTNPFNLSPIDGYIYGRGVSDNKGPVLAALYAAADLAQKKALECDIVFLIEGEEESGSRDFVQTVQRNKKLIRNVDWILLANSYWLDDHIPCLTYGMRGVIHAKLLVTSPQQNLHSGMDGSSLVDEPLEDLSKLLATFTGPGRYVPLPNFYDSIATMSDVEEERYISIVDALLPGHPEIIDGELFIESLKYRWSQPSVTLHSIEVPRLRNKTSISRLARAALSLRLVPNQSPNKIAKDLIEFLQDEFASLSSKNKLFVQIVSKADPWVGDPNNEIFKTLEEAITQAWAPKDDGRRLYQRVSTDSNSESPLAALARSPSIPTSFTLASTGKYPADPIPHKPLYIREGGSIPMISFLEKEFKAPVAHLPCGQASDRAHLANERIRVENLHKSREIFMRVFKDLPRKAKTGEKRHSAP